MSSVALVGLLQVTLPVATDLAPLAVVVLGGGLVGMSIRNMFESIMSEDEEGEAPAADAPEAGGGLMAEEEGDGDDGDDLEGLGGLDDDGDDLGGLDDDGFDDGFDEMDGEDGDLDEFEHRLDEMEAEVGSLSSTVNTVRNENEQISESVAEVEENVRKLLDIYEMVTRGVNPFADDIDGGMAGGGMGDGGGFGLFEDDGGEETQQVDEDIAQADAEGFFDEDLVDDDEELEADADVGDMLSEGDSDAPDEDLDDEFDEVEDLDGDDDGGGGGTSFEDLKEEYESGDAEWADEELEDVEDDDGDEFAEFDEDFEEDDGAESVADADDVAEASAEALEDADDALADDELFDDVIEEEPTDASEPEATETPTEMDANESEPAPTATAEDPPDTASTDPAPEPTTNTEATTGTEPTTDTDPTTETPARTGSDQAETGDDENLYLASLPGGYAADLLVIEWLEYLVEEAGVREAAGAIDYYESIDWISPAVADDLEDYLAGFDGGGNAALTIDHHARSLRYIGELNGGGVDQVAAQRLSHGGGTDGVQR